FGEAPIDVSIWNWGGGVLSFHAAAHPPWLDVVPQGGASSGPRDPVAVSLAVDRTGLAAGHYAGLFEVAPDAEQGCRPITIRVSMEVPTGGGDLAVTPADPLSSSGLVGGPFAPASRDYLLENRGDAPLDWTAGATQPWLDVSATSGTLAPGASVQV